MSQVHIAFQEGFSNDTIVVRINGKEVARKSGLESQATIALAGAENLAVDAVSGTLTLEVPTRGISKSFEVDFRQFPYLGISIVGATLTLKQSREPFEYM